MEILTDMKPPGSSLVVPGIWSVEPIQKRKLPRIQPEESQVWNKFVHCKLFEMLGPNELDFTLYL